jgi:hypothetical protein
MLFSTQACDELKVMTKYEKTKLSLKGGMGALILFLSGWKGN